MKHLFDTSVGAVEVLVDEQSGVVSAYRFDSRGRPVAAVLESWDHIDLADVLARETGIPTAEAKEIATALGQEWDALCEEPTTQAVMEEELPPKGRATRAEILATAVAALAALFLLAVGLWMTLPSIF